MLAYFSLTLFVSATLLFLVQPMIGKMILPQLGGTPAVWNTCMVFFQGVLLVGYGYTHLLTTTQPARRQVLIQAVLLFLPFLVLPFSLGDWEPPAETNPIFSLLFKLTIMVGLPFFLVSTTAPLLQKWFFHTGHPAAKDPYFLYGASNFGSMLGLMLYPTVIEPWLQVTAPEGLRTWETQVHLWTFMYALFVALVTGCAVIVWQALARKWQTAEAAPAAPEAQAKPAPAAAQATAVTASKRRPVKIETAAATHPAGSIAKSAALDAPNDDITLWRRLRWIGLAAAPTSLMLGATTYVTTDIAAVAFFWIVPLALYLLTFILVFARWPVVWTGTPHTVVMYLQPCFLLFLVLRMNVHDMTVGMLLDMVLHLGAFFTTALMCHGELAKDRPSTKHLTEFYFWMSFGGVLGGLFNALFAPIFFQYGPVNWEYPIAMVFACLMRSNLVERGQMLIPGDSSPERPTRVGYALDLLFPLATGILCFVATYYCQRGHVPTLLQTKFIVAALVVGALAMSLRPLRFGLAVASLFIAVGIYDRLGNDAIYEARGFFGRMHVREIRGNWQPMPEIPGTVILPHERRVTRILMHGGINHGAQVVGYKDDRYVMELLLASTAAANALPVGHPSLLTAPALFEEETRDKLEFQSEQMTMLRRREPGTYFHERNGVAEVFYKLCFPNAQPVGEIANMTGKADVRLPASMLGLACGDQPAWNILANTQSEPPYAVVGLGTGILASYAKPYQHVDIYEIDPLVKNLSIVPGYVPPWDPERAKMPKLPDPTFYYVHDAQERWAKIDVKLGDGRLVIKKAPEKYYHAIMLDAFSSDAIPVHLLTVDAVKVYLDKLAEGGVLIFNTTNRYVRIEGVLSRIAQELDLDCLRCEDWTFSETDHPDRYSADWVVLQRKIDKKTYQNGGRPIAERLEAERVRLAWNGGVVKGKDGRPVVDKRWFEVAPLPGRAWTDGYSNMLNPQVMPWLTEWLSFFRRPARED